MQLGIFYQPGGQGEYPCAGGYDDEYLRPRGGFRQEVHDGEAAEGHGAGCQDGFDKGRAKIVGNIEMMPANQNYN